MTIEETLKRMSEEAPRPTVLQVTNISHTITKEQIQHFLEYVGRIRELVLYPEGENLDPTTTKVAFAKFDNPDHIDVALHLTNTVMVDRALILLPYCDLTLPDEHKGMRVAAPHSTVAGMIPPTQEWTPNVVNMVCGTGTQRTIQTIDARLVELGLQQYPPLPAKTDASKVEEIRRTVYVSNLDPSVSPEQLVQFFSNAGEVMYIRMAGDENLPSRNAYVEFTNQKSVPTALAYNGVMLTNRHVKVVHSTQSISGKPQTKGQEAVTREIDEAMKKYKDVDKLISAAASSATKSSAAPPGSSSSSSSRRRRSRSRSHGRRHKSRDRKRSRERRRSPDRSRKSSRYVADINTTDKKTDKVSETQKKDRDRKKRSRSRDRRRSRSRGRKRSSSRSRRDRDRKRSRSRDRRRSRSRDRKSLLDRKSKRRSSSKDRRSTTSKDPPIKRDYDAEEKDTEKNGTAENGRGEKTDAMAQLESNIQT